jgi:diguanylate cyclase
VARYGGEEFVIMLPECTRSDAVAVLERVRDQLEVAVRNASAPSFTVSFGVAASAFDRTFGETLEIADQALLRAKAEGRNRIVVSELVEADSPVL